eukprot:TRINITY_DN23186_c0_g1_i2.p2 TRINITY_DN23186_c0_g1~~TRINITY_DN23186_c0_g1_i2.p2  ORF type:complete len:126 (-),score=31.42 TRINITY_DN23186_c0_g1_i2:54-398(-)
MAGLLEGCEEEIVEKLACKLPSYVGSCLLMAHLLARMYDEWHAKQIEAPTWYQSGVQTVAQELAEICRNAPSDSLTPTHDAVKTVLGESNPVSKIMQDLQEKNMSASNTDKIYN